jgi:formyltetrahydrofolate deformylase
MSQAAQELVLSRLLVSCPDQPGIVAAVSSFLQDAGANIVSSSQFSTDPVGGRFFMRTEFASPPGARDGLAERFGTDVADRFDMKWRVWESERKKRVAIFVSAQDHCLLELLWRWRRGTLAIDIPFVVSNHDRLRADVEGFGLPFHHVPVPKGGKAAAEDSMLDLLKDKADVVVLARYMQILSGDFLARVGVPVINIHHSFLPAFEGAGPYEKARERGVKLIGATGHYVTEDLDAGPIIEQDVIRVTHSDHTAELTRRGADVERAVFARAVQWHCEDRVLLHGNTTVIF